MCYNSIIVHLQVVKLQKPCMYKNDLDIRDKDEFNNSTMKGDLLINIHSIGCSTSL